MHEMATYRCDDARGCVMQFWPPDDEHVCSKHVEAWNKLIVKQKFCASIWLITEINILRCTVSKTSKIGFHVFVIYLSKNTSLKMFTIRNWVNSVYNVIHSHLFIHTCWFHSHTEASVHGNNICKIKYFKLYMMFHITSANLSTNSTYIYTALQQFMIYGKKR